MNTNWSRIVVFGLLFGISGSNIGRCCGVGCGREHGACSKSMACCDKDGNCEHGGTYCKPGGPCDKQGYHHAALRECHGKACCTRGAWPWAPHGTLPLDRETQAIMDRLKDLSFQGDTTIAITNGTVNVVRKGDRTEVRVNVQDSVKKEVNVQVVHSHEPRLPSPHKPVQCPSSLKAC